MRFAEPSIKNGGLKGIKADRKDARATTTTLGAVPREALEARPKESDPVGSDPISRSVARASFSSALIL